LFSNNSGLSAIVTCAIFVLSGCASAPPPLPPDTTSINAAHQLTLADFDAADLALSCSEISQQEQAMTANIDAAAAKITASRQSNEAIGLVASVAFTPLWLATDNNTPEKKAYETSYARRDKLRELSNLKHCNSN